MSEKRTISGVRTDLSPSDFSANLNKVGNNKRSKSSKISKGTFGKINYVLSALGLMPMLTSDSGSKSYRSHGHVGGVHHHSSNSFRESYRVEQTPRPRTHEDMVREHIAHDAYMDMVDGKGDNER